jgi:Phasin protein
MPTTQEEKPAKPRQRNRKTDQRKAKGEKKAEAPQADDPVSAVMAPMEAAQVEITPVEIAPIEITPVEITPVEITPVEIAEVEVAAVEPGPAAITPEAITMEKAGDAALSGEVLPPEVREHAPQTAGAQAIALAYGDYTRKSVLAGRFLVERLVTVRSFEEAIEIQGEFAKQAYANFVAHSERICELYGAWAQQYFGSLDKLATQWTRIGR